MGVARPPRALALHSPVPSCGGVIQSGPTPSAAAMTDWPSVTSAENPYRFPAGAKTTRASPHTPGAVCDASSSLENPSAVTPANAISSSPSGVSAANAPTVAAVNFTEEPCVKVSPHVHPTNTHLPLVALYAHTSYTNVPLTHVAHSTHFAHVALTSLTLTSHSPLATRFARGVWLAYLPRSQPQQEVAIEVGWETPTT